MYYVYLLESLSNEQVYVGSTKNLKARLEKHNNGLSISTKHYRPWKVIYYETYPTEKLARERESKLEQHGNAMKEVRRRLKIGKYGAGFTLVEVLTVIAIIGILATLGTYTYLSSLIRSRDSQRIADLQFVRNGLEQFYLDNRTYPTFEGDGELPEATWQLESGYDCQVPGKKFLAPKYLDQIPQDPSYKFAIDSNCSSNAFGQYLYFSIPKDEDLIKTGYYLLARMERLNNVNYTSDVATALEKYTIPTFCDSVQFNSDPSNCSQNYFVTTAKNN